MASFTAGTTFTDGVANDVTAAKLGALVTNATPTSGLIQDRTAETVIASNDTVLIGDASDSNSLKRMTVDNLMKADMSGNINSTSGTIGTFNSTSGTIATFNSTTGTIPTLTSVTKITSGTGTAASPAISPTGDSNTGVFFPAADTIAASTNGTERVRVDSSGNVGIGIAPLSSDTRLSVAGGYVSLGGYNAGTTGASPQTGYLSFSNNITSGQAEMDIWNGTDPSIYTNTGILFTQRLTSTTRRDLMFLHNNGNVGIGTNSPTQILDIYSPTLASPTIRGDANTNLIIHRASSDATRATILFRKSRGNQASPSAVSSGDNLGAVQFQAFGGTNNRSIASVAGFVDTYTSDTDISSFLTLNTTPSGSVTQVERLRIDSSGNVGIGTTSPAYKLDVGGDILSNSSYRLSNGTVNANFQLNGTNSPIINVVSNHGLEFRTNNTERLRIDSSGNVGIGATSPVNKLEIVGSFGRGAPVTKVADFTIADTENWLIVNKGSSCTVTLPAASSWTGREFTIKVITAHAVVSASSNVVPRNSATAGTAILAATAGSWATLVSNGTNWVIMCGS